MKRFITVLALVLASAFCANAQEPMPSLQKEPDPPKPTVLHRVFDKKFLIVTAISVASSVAATYTINRCRQDHGIGPCTDGGYGPFRAREILRQVQTGFLVLPSFKIKQIEDRKEMKHKLWWLFPAINTVLNTGVMIQNSRKHYGPKED
jgi:hypothetical protein